MREGYRCPRCECALKIWATKKGIQNKCFNCQESFNLDELEKSFIGQTPRKRKSLKNLDSVSENINREELLNIIQNMDNLKHQALLSVLYLTGGRVSEVVCYKDKETGEKKEGLHKYNFSNGEYKGMPVFWIKGMRVLKMRTNAITKRGIPISPRKDWEFIFFVQTYLETLERDEPLFKGMVRQTVWSILKDYGLYPHLLRDLRVFDLMQFYGWSESKIVKFIGWESYDTIKHYLKLRPLDLIDKEVF